jgi:hypothetical protein
LKEIYSEIEINASSATVWQTLLDFDQFPEWNPYIRSAEGKPVTGKRILIRTQPPGSRRLVFHPIILTLDQNKELKWRGSSLPRFLFSGEHSFLLEQLDSKRTRFIQKETFTGILVPFVKRLIGKRTAVGFSMMNEALKKRTESM